MTAPDHGHAIEQLRWLIAHDFQGRRGMMMFSGILAGLPHDSEHWWDHELRRKDIAKLRSYIGAVRTLEGRT